MITIIMIYFINGFKKTFTIKAIMKRIKEIPFSHYIMMAIPIIMHLSLRIYYIHQLHEDSSVHVYPIHTIRIIQHIIKGDMHHTWFRT